MTTAYLAAEGFESQLREELQRAGVEVRPHERLLVADAAVPAAWAANIWHDCVELPVTSIGEAAKALRDIQRNWAMYAPLHHRRAALIQERLPHVSAKPIVFPAAAPARLGHWPQPGERCLDLGASPGGWTWALAKLGATVVAIDKAPLDPKVAAMPGVEWRGESAFGLDPASVGPVDWLFSDIVCYPARLLKLVERWQASGLVRNFVCTLK